MVDTIYDDLRWAIRHARGNPVLAGAVVVTLAVSIAAATTAFGVATAVLWRPLPFADAGRVVFVWEDVAGKGPSDPFRVTSSRFAAWRDHSTSFSSMALFGAAGFTVASPDGASSVRGVRVSANYFETLGVAPMVGRAFMPSDEVPGQHQVVVLSHAMWQQRYGGRLDAVGATLRLNGDPYTIVGVMPPVVFPAWPVNPATVTLHAESRQLWVPIAATPAFHQNTRSHVFGVVARLAPGVSIARASDELNRTTDAAAPDPHAAQVTPVRDQLVRTARLPLLVLVAAALAVLLIACANLAALHVSAFEGRRAELSVRAALGAGTGRLVTQLLAEALLLSSAGGVAGIGLAWLALAALPRWMPSTVPLLTAPSLDLRVAGFGVAVAVVAGLALAAWPVGRLLVATPAPRGVSARPRSHVYRALVVSQVAITAALVVCAALLTQSLWSVRAQDPGFIVDGVLVADIGLPADGYRQPGQIVAFEERLLERLGGRPDMRGAALAYDHPLEANWIDSYTLSGDVARDRSDTTGQAELRIVSPSYFDALGIEIVDGRALTERDGLGAAGAVVVNEAFARQAGGRILGRRLGTGSARGTWGDAVPAEFEIVGIAENERVRGLEQPAQPALYLSTRQFPQREFSLIVTTTRDPLPLAADVRAAVRVVEPEATVGRPASLDGILSEQLMARRVTTDVIGAFAAVALALAALGLYGLVAVVVASRTREIGVRLALGASPSRVAGHVVSDSLRSAAVGLAAGLVFALVAGRLLEGLLVGVTPRDPLTLATVAVALLTVAVMAALLPARRAARVDPARALRAE